MSPGTFLKNTVSKSMYASKSNDINIYCMRKLIWLYLFVNRIIPVLLGLSSIHRFKEYVTTCSFELFQYRTKHKINSLHVFISQNPSHESL